MRVVFLTAVLPQYRVQFHERVRDRLAGAGIRYDLVYGQSHPNQATKGSDAHITWGKRVLNRYVSVGRTSFVWQPALRDIWNCDLAIVGQESRFLINYLAQADHGLRRSKLALWGHGRNFQLDDTG